MSKPLPKPGDVLWRSVTVEVDQLATREKGDERIPISISSEYPVERRFGHEVLVHTREAVDMEHAATGLPFLDSHDDTRQLGVVEEVHIGADRRLRGMLRKGNHPDATWMFRDIEDGVRLNLSAGYAILAAERDEKDPDTVRVTRWKPMEVSTVAVPADISVGIGRSANKDGLRFELVLPKGSNVDGYQIGDRSIIKVRPTGKREDGTDVGPCANPSCAHPYEQHEDGGMTCQAEDCVCPAYLQAGAESSEPRTAAPTSPAPRPKERTMSEEVTGSDAAPAHKAGPKAVSLEDKQNEHADIVRLGTEHGMQDRTAEWIQKGFSRDRVCAEILAQKAKMATAVTPPGYLGMSDRDGLKFNYTRAIQNIMAKRWEEDGGLEKEVSDAVAKRLGKATGGFFVPLDLPVMTRAAVTGNVAGTSSLGGAGVQTSILSLIDLLRNKMLVRQLGATVLSGLTGNISFPRHIVANTMAWEGENPSTAHANSAATFDNVNLSPKTAMASSAYSRQLLIQESFDVSAFIQNDLATVLALGLDLAALDGTGSSNQPTGIMRQTGVTVITHTGSNGGIPTWAELVSYETNVATNNADIGTIAWVTTPGLRGKLKTVLKTTTAGSTFLWESDNTINGYSANVTTQMPSNFTFGTATTIAHGVAFGVWSEVLIGEWGGALEVVIDPYSSAKQGMVEITQLLMADVGVRHPKSFAITKSALIA